MDIKKFIPLFRNIRPDVLTEAFVIGCFAFFADIVWNLVVWDQSIFIDQPNKLTTRSNKKENENE